MPNHPDRVRRAYTPSITAGRVTSGYSVVDGQFYVTYRLPVRELQALPRCEQAEALRRLRVQLADALARGEW